jgi:hypothetical protein
MRGRLDAEQSGAARGCAAPHVTIPSVVVGEADEVRR